jgi:hypothetical protein
MKKVAPVSVPPSIVDTRRDQIFPVLDTDDRRASAFRRRPAFSTGEQSVGEIGEGLAIIRGAEAEVYRHDARGERQAL